MGGCFPTCELALPQTRSSSVSYQLPDSSGTWGMFQIRFFGNEKPAELAILPGDEGDLALSSALGALEAVVVPALYRAAEESATRRTNLIQSVGAV